MCAPQRGLLPGVLEQFVPGGGAERHQPELVGVDEVDDVLGELGIGVAEQRIAELDQARPVGIGRAEQPAEHAHRQLPGNLFDEVELVELERLLDDRRRQLPDLLLVGFDDPPGEHLRDQSPEPGVLRWVHLHHRPTGGGLLVAHVLEPDALPRRVSVELTADVEDVAVPGDRPEPAAVALVEPGDRILGAQAGRRWRGADRGCRCRGT